MKKNSVNVVRNSVHFAFGMFFEVMQISPQKLFLEIDNDGMITYPAMPNFFYSEGVFQVNLSEIPTSINVQDIEKISVSKNASDEVVVTYRMKKTKADQSVKVSDLGLNNAEFLKFFGFCESVVQGISVAA